MLIPILIFAVCFGGGAFAAAQWLPNLGPGRVAGLAFFTVCGLLAGALSSVGLHIYLLARDLGSRDLGLGNSELLAAHLRDILFDAGTLVGLAAIVYLLAPQRRAPADEITALAAEAE